MRREWKAQIFGLEETAVQNDEFAVHVNTAKVMVSISIVLLQTTHDEKIQVNLTQS